MDGRTFIFPDSLDRLAGERLGLTPPDRTDGPVDLAARISGISFRRAGQMTFCLDGRKSGVCRLTPDEAGWLDTGMLTPLELACRHAAGLAGRAVRTPVQMDLF